MTTIVFNFLIGMVGGAAAVIILLVVLTGLAWMAVQFDKFWDVHDE